MIISVGAVATSVGQFASSVGQFATSVGRFAASVDVPSHFVGTFGTYRRCQRVFLVLLAFIF